MKTFGEKQSGIEYKKRVGSYGILIENKRIGVVKSAVYNDFFLTGGGIDEGESDEEALRREAREEIGFEIEIGEKIGEAIEYFYSESEKRYVAKECHFYRVALVGESDGTGKHELVWLSANNLDQMHHECYKWIVAKELNKISD